MRTLAKVCKVLVWVVLVVGVLFQALSVMGIEYQKGFSNNNISTVPLVLATVVMVMAVILFTALRRRKFIPLIIATAMAVCFVVLAYYIQVKTLGRNLNGIEQYGYTLTVGKILRNNAMLAIEPLLMFPIWLVHREDCCAADLAEEQETVPSVLSGLSDFTLSTLPEEKEVPKLTKKRKQ